MKTYKLFLALCISSHHFGYSFQFPSFPAVATPTSKGVKGKKELLGAVSFTGNGKTASLETQKKVLNLVRSLETKNPPSENLLSSPKEAKKLDGTWFLQYTSPSEIGEKSEDMDTWTAKFATEGESNIETKKFNAQGTVSAAGISVDTSNRITKQNIDVTNMVVSNEVELNFGTVFVSGGFRPSPNVPNRAIVAFDTCDITFNTGFTLKLGSLFTLISFIRGTKDNGWLETTYIDEDMRIGRGNKGTMFILTREYDAVAP